MLGGTGMGNISTAAMQVLGSGSHTSTLVVWAAPCMCEMPYKVWGLTLMRLAHGPFVPLPRTHALILSPMPTLSHSPCPHLSTTPVQTSHLASPPVPFRSALRSTSPKTASSVSVTSSCYHCALSR